LKFIIRTISKTSPLHSLQESSTAQSYFANWILSSPKLLCTVELLFPSSVPVGNHIGPSEVRALPVRRCRRAAWQTLVVTINGIIFGPSEVRAPAVGVAHAGGECSVHY
jgi:hypothetical protein